MKRRRRKAGSRRSRIPFRALAVLFGAVGLLIFFTCLAVAIFDRTPDGEMFSDLGDFSTVFFAIAAVLYWFGRLAHAEKYIEKDDRPPVLYLRSFKEERDWFAFIRRRPFDHYPKPRDADRINVRTPTLETFFALTFKQRLGPLVALGSPEDYLPPNLYTLRHYMADENWQVELAALARKAACIVVVTSVTSNLLWEYDFMRREGLHRKLFLLTRPAIYNIFGRSLRARLLDLIIIGARSWRAGLHAPVRWEEFAATLRDAAYLVDIPDPGPGSVIGFTPSGQALTLRTGLMKASEYVDAMSDWLVKEDRGITKLPL